VTTEAQPSAFSMLTLVRPWRESVEEDSSAYMLMTTFTMSSCLFSYCS
jgi:hypothetical protein